jgi:N-acetylglucosamine-6-sulfatase
VLEAGPTRIGGPDLYRGIRTPRYKYLEYSTGEVEFYDLLNDPDEMVSLTNNPAHDATQAQLRQLFLRYRSCAGATCRS